MKVNGPVHRIMQAHESGKIDMSTANCEQVAEQFGCSPSTAYLARRELGIEKKHLYVQLIEAHHNGEVDLASHTYDQIREAFPCTEKTITKAIRVLEKEGKIVRVRKWSKRVEGLAIKDKAAARHYWYTYRKVQRLIQRWGVIDERRGKTRNQWKTYCKHVCG